jgi:hypothetical protein
MAVQVALLVEIEGAAECDSWGLVGEASGGVEAVAAAAAEAEPPLQDVELTVKAHLTGKSAV